ncbi:MAG: 4Fe-4S dicluster domain-containing protein [Desulfobacterales bacterium]|nr:4Fe-4S dicluster domain-containing protein [Desulfobacterales bacterium]
MDLSRRGFFKVLGAGGAALGTGLGTVNASEIPAPSLDSMGCLVDTTLCVGCRKCEQSCNQRHGLPTPGESFEELTVLEKERRMDETSYTVVNKYYPENIGTLTWRERPTFVKFQCMHCNDPSCVSACIVGALTKEENGAVTYDAKKCIGCRYCMVACPFQVPAYEYDNALTPQVRKCTFCFDYVEDGGLPACAQVCPREVMTFGKKKDLLKLAEWKMKNNPDKYVDHIYGEKEVGGTSWLYLASEPFETIGFPKLSHVAPPRLTEKIQHSLFQYFAAPIILYTFLGGVMMATGFMKNGKKKDKTVQKGDTHESS